MRNRDRIVNTLVERVIRRLVEAPETETIPASKDPAAREMNSELTGKLTYNPKSPPSQRAMKVNAVRKELDLMGYMSDKAKAQIVTQKLPAWYDKLDPSEALISTAKDLADRFAVEN